MKMNKGTIIRTILVIATCFNTALMATDFAQFHNATVDMVYKIVSVVLNFVIVACATYYNNDYSEEACIGTGVTRQMKAERDTEYIGDYFFDEEEDAIEEEEDEDEQESMEAD
jgi:hypothetical protein